MVTDFSEYKGILKTVHSSKLEDCTREGWVVVDAYDEQSTEPTYGTEPRVIPHGPNNQYSDEGTVNTTRHHTVTSRYFVLRLEEDSHFARLNEEIAVLKKQLDEKSRTLKESEARFATSSLDLVRAQDEVTSLRSSAGRMADERQAEIRKMRTMEADLGKLRKALGELKVREILGEAT